MRDQKQIADDPQVGDVATRGYKSREVTHVSRSFSGHPGEIEYRTNTGEIRTCWITTWRSWCMKKE